MTQILRTILGYFENCHFFNKDCCVYFGQLFETIWLLSITNTWSHCFAQALCVGESEGEMRLSVSEREKRLDVCLKESERMQLKEREN